MSGFLIPAASNTSITPSETKALSITCLIADSISSSGLPVPVVSNFCNLDLTAWKKPISSFASKLPHREWLWRML